MFSRRVWTVVCVAVVSIGATFETRAFSQPPDLFRQYQFIPRLSTLEVSGGFAGLDLRMPIHGSFGFVTGYHFQFPTLEPFAAFVDVKAEAINPTDFGPYSFDIDETLNLSGLDGFPLPVGGPVNVYRFEGADGQGAPMALHALTLGRWLYMRGRNDPPCCDFFNYGIRGLARQVPHPDFDADGLVDHRDLDYWQAHVGLDNGADADGNGTTDGGDFLHWQRMVGDTAPSFDYFDALISAAVSANSAVTTAAVPEPATMALLHAGMITLWLCRSRRSVNTKGPRKWPTVSVSSRSAQVS